MTLNEIFDDLTYGELSQVVSGGAETFGVSVEHRKKIVSHVNRGLEVLHRRFRLKMGTLEVPLVADQRQYPLESADLPIIKVEYVRWPAGLEKLRGMATNLECHLPINEINGEYSVFMPRHNVLEVPQDIRDSDATKLEVVYRAGHPRIDKDEGQPLEPENVHIDLPEAFREPLLFYIGSMITNPLGPGLDGFHEGNNYYQKFEMACRALENQGINMTESVAQTKFERRGFV